MAKRKRPRPDAEELPPEEAQRRERQRKLREIALQLRAKGKEYHPRHKELVDKKKGAGVGKGPARPKVQVAVIPIFWKQRPEEQQRVLDAAKAVQQLLINELGPCVALDASNVKTPGQKMRNWEERGVKVRVELGPSEASKGTCVLARAKGVGVVASKQTMAVGPLLLERLKSWLPDAGSAQQDSAAGKRDSQPAGATATAPATATTACSDAEDAEPSAKNKKKKKRKLDTSGAAQPAAAEAAAAAGEQATTTKPRKKKQKQVPDEPGSDVLPPEDAAAAGQELDGGTKKAKRKKAKQQAAQVEGGQKAHVDVDTDTAAAEQVPAVAKGKKKKDKERHAASGSGERTSGEPPAAVAPGGGHAAGKDRQEHGGRPQQNGAGGGGGGGGGLFMSGDALEDDFGDLIEVQAEEDTQLGKRERARLERNRAKLRKKAGKAGKAGALGGGRSEDAGDGGVGAGAVAQGAGLGPGLGHGGKRKGASKVVVF